MKITYNASGAQRKELVKAISEITRADKQYLGAPTFAYAIDYFTVDRDGNLSFDDRADSEEVENLIEGLAKRGFIADPAEGQQEDEEEQPINTSQFAGPYELPDDSKEMTEEEMREAMDEQDRLIAEAAAQQAAREAQAKAEQEQPEMDTESGANTSIIISRDLLTDQAFENLLKLIEAKDHLIAHAFGIADAHIDYNDTEVVFPWVRDGEDTVVATLFIAKLFDMAKNAKRVTAKVKETENERYAFRCFLLRLGFVGPEYKEARKRLLRDLPGSSAFKSGRRAGENAETEC